MNDKMIKKLSEEERKKTKSLYIEVFPEDEGAFADYYYEEVVPKNEIYAVPGEGKFLAMIHLNPYELMIGETQEKIPYIVAVATHPDYRHQGMMAVLIQKALTDLNRERVPFAFLMPAKEAIYRPFGFQNISRQNRMELPVKEYLGKEGLQSYPATFADVPDLCWISNKLLKKEKGTYARRTEAYYERLLLEQQCQEGDIAVVTKDGMICGWFFTSLEDGIPAVREAVVEKELEPLLFPTIAACFRYDEKVKLYAFPEALNQRAEEKPLMMGRIINLGAYFALIKEKIPEGFSFAVTDRLIPENNGIFLWQDGRLQKTEDNHRIPIFGIEEIMGKFPLPGPVFLNEVV